MMQLLIHHTTEVRLLKKIFYYIQTILYLLCIL